MIARPDIESELSYAYLHAVASRAGYACYVSNRHVDNAGIDATVQSENKYLDPSSILTSILLHIQLKATFVEPTEIDGKFSYSLTVPHYEQLRSTSLGSTHRIMVVLYLPRNEDGWLSHTEDGLIAKRCAYWVSLFGAPTSINPSHQTVYIPRSQILSPASLKELMIRCSRQEEIRYEG